MLPRVTQLQVTAGHSYAVLPKNKNTVKNKTTRKTNTQLSEHCNTASTQTRQQEIPRLPCDTPEGRPGPDLHRRCRERGPGWQSREGGGVAGPSCIFAVLLSPCPEAHGPAGNTQATSSHSRFLTNPHTLSHRAMGHQNGENITRRPPAETTAVKYSPSDSPRRLCRASVRKRTSSLLSLPTPGHASARLTPHCGGVVLKTALPSTGPPNGTVTKWSGFSGTGRGRRLPGRRVCKRFREADP